jgi:hypothetical protein
MQVYAEELQSAEVPALWLSLAAIATIQIVTVQYFELPRLGLVRAISEEGEISFHPKEVVTRVEGVLPTFGQVFDMDVKRKIVRKEQILDRVRICDLHLPDRGCIVRLHDNCYKFDRGMQLEVPRSLAHIAPTIQERWAVLSEWLSDTMPQAARYDDFTTFADMAMGFPELLAEIDPHIDLSRTHPSLWDNCFQLYSSIFFCRNAALP